MAFSNINFGKMGELFQGHKLSPEPKHRLGPDSDQAKESNKTKDSTQAKNSHQMENLLHLLKHIIQDLTHKPHPTNKNVAPWLNSPAQMLYKKLTDMNVKQILSNLSNEDKKTILDFYEKNSDIIKKYKKGTSGVIHKDESGESKDSVNENTKNKKDNKENNTKEKTTQSKAYQNTKNGAHLLKAKDQADETKKREHVKTRLQAEETATQKESPGQKRGAHQSMEQPQSVKHKLSLTHFGDLNQMGKIKETIKFLFNEKLLPDQLRKSIEHYRASHLSGKELVPLLYNKLKADELEKLIYKKDEISKKLDRVEGLQKKNKVEKNKKDNNKKKKKKKQENEEEDEEDEEKN